MSKQNRDIAQTTCGLSSLKPSYVAIGQPYAPHTPCDRVIERLQRINPGEVSLSPPLTMSLRAGPKRFLTVRFTKHLCVGSRWAQADRRAGRGLLIERLKVWNLRMIRGAMRCRGAIVPPAFRSCEPNETSRRNAPISDDRAGRGSLVAADRPARRRENRLGVAAAH